MPKLFGSRAWASKISIGNWEDREGQRVPLGCYKSVKSSLMEFQTRKGSNNKHRPNSYSCLWTWSGQTNLFEDNIGYVTVENETLDKYFKVNEEIRKSKWEKNPRRCICVFNAVKYSMEEVTEHWTVGEILSWKCTEETERNNRTEVYMGLRELETKKKSLARIS